MFRVGQKVVCVNNRSVPELKVDTIYTVDKCYGGLFVESGEIAVHLREIKQASGVPYYACRFRPVVERETDISIFTAMLNPAKKKRRAHRPVTVSA